VPIQGKRLKVNGEESIYVYDQTVGVEEIVPLIIKKNRCIRLVPTLNISWAAI
jgi:hypothetical protein